MILIRRFRGECELGREGFRRRSREGLQCMLITIQMSKWQGKTVLRHF